jgi:hypothetical protein
MSFVGPPADPGDRTVARAFGALLIAAGILIMLLCGLCSLAALGIFLSEAFGRPSEILSILATVGAIGGVPAAFGFGLFAWGRSLRRKA